jgi:hypothetical protein
LKSILYRVKLDETIYTDTQTHGLLSGLKSEPSAQSRLNPQTLGVYSTHEEANAEAKAAYEKFLSEGWADGTPVTTP